MDGLSTLTEVATLKLLVELLQPLFHAEFSRCLGTQKAAGALPPKRALLLYKVLGEVATLTNQLHTHQQHFLEEARTGQVWQALLFPMADVIAQLATQVRHLAAAVRAIEAAWKLEPQPVVDRLTLWVSEAGGARRFVVDLRWETARRPGSRAPWQPAVAETLARLVTQLTANHRQVQDGIAAVRHGLRAEFAFSEEFFPKA
jgi:hypothetical protein